MSDQLTIQGKEGSCNLLRHRGGGFSHHCTSNLPWPKPRDPELCYADDTTVKHQPHHSTVASPVRWTECNKIIPKLFWRHWQIPGRVPHHCGQFSASSSTRPTPWTSEHALGHQGGATAESSQRTPDADRGTSSSMAHSWNWFVLPWRWWVPPTCWLLFPVPLCKEDSEWPQQQQDCCSPNKADF